MERCTWGTNQSDNCGWRMPRPNWPLTTLKLQIAFILSPNIISLHQRIDHLSTLQTGSAHLRKNGTPHPEGFQVRRHDRSWSVNCKPTPRSSSLSVTNCSKGLSYSLSQITLPSLLHLPTAPLASQAHAYIRSRTETIQKWVSITATSALFTAFFLAPRRLRHPYLVYTAVLTLLGSSQRLTTKIANRISPPRPITPAATHGRTDSELAESAVMVGQSSDSSDAGDDYVNGEVVRRGVERNALNQTVRFGFWGVAFIFSVIGIWGDGA